MVDKPHMPVHHRTMPTTTALKKAVAATAFRNFQAGATIDGAIDYEIMKGGPETRATIVLRVREQENRPPRYFRVQVSEMM